MFISINNVIVSPPLTLIAGVLLILIAPAWGDKLLQGNELRSNEFKLILPD